MAKPKKGKTEKKAPVAPEPLTDEQRYALSIQHKSRYETTFAAKKKADADFKNACKLAKAELGEDAVDDIKDMILGETEEGEAKLQARIERAMRIARWLDIPVGAEPNMFETGSPDSVTRAGNEGRKAGLESKSPLKPPYASGTPEYDAYVDSWHAGQRELIGRQKKRDAEEFDQVGDQPETSRVHQ